ncbi:MAG: LPS export ABC transporter periplasmic protein LptC [Betaproteobacteria bacterium]|nr:LPS export ABC transporter periplasmic protein LptC [Betaproteobacteria bacterium]
MQLGGRSAIAFPLLLLFLLAGITFWINRAVQPVAPKIDGSSRHDPDYIMTDFVTTQTDANGKLRYKLAAKEMRHFPDDDSTELQRPRYTQFETDKPYTQVHALRGYVSSDGEDVELVDQVRVIRQAFAGKGEMTVDTEHLNIRPNDELVTTASPVIIRQAPKTVIYATGMEYEKKKRTLTLKHKVKAHYERPIGAAKKSKKGAQMTNKSTVTKKSIVTRKPTMKPSAKLPNQVKKKSATINNPVGSNKQTTEQGNGRIRRRYE